MNEHKPKWEKVESIGKFTFWKYEDRDEKLVYNCTKDGNPPTTESGYYSYAYLLKVKGVMPGITLQSIFQSLIKE